MDQPEQATIQDLIDAAAGKTADEMLEEINASGAVDKVGDAEAFAAMLAKAGTDPDYASQLCDMGEPEASPLMPPA
jgi:hypothetical protein